MKKPDKKCKTQKAKPLHAESPEALAQLVNASAAKLIAIELKRMDGYVKAFVQTEMRRLLLASVGAKARGYYNDEIEIQRDSPLHTSIGPKVLKHLEGHVDKALETVLPKGKILAAFEKALREFSSEVFYERITTAIDERLSGLVNEVVDERLKTVDSLLQLESSPTYQRAEEARAAIKTVRGPAADDPDDPTDDDLDASGLY